MKTGNKCPNSLTKHVGNIRLIDPMGQQIDYQSSKWSSYIGKSSEFGNVSRRFPTSVSRADLRSLGSEAIANKKLSLHLFIVTMIFGFGNVGYGPYRTSKMLDGIAKQPDMLSKVMDLLVAGDIVGAHNELALPLCRTPFQSKFFYAVGLGAKLSPLPLILDDRVYRALDVLHRRGELDQWRYYSRSSWTAEGYRNYVNDMNTWASSLGCEADQIEMYVFKHAEQIP